MEQVAGKSFKRVVSVGGGAKNPDWLQIQADVFDAEITCLEVEQGPGLGAAMLAAVGLGWFPTVTACADVFVAYKDVVRPIPENVVAYEKAYALYTQVYGATKELCHALAKE